jgi:hypothetical protein
MQQIGMQQIRRDNNSNVRYKETPQEDHLMHLMNKRLLKKKDGKTLQSWSDRWILDKSGQYKGILSEDVPEGNSKGEETHMRSLMPKTVDKDKTGKLKMTLAQAHKDLLLQNSLPIRKEGQRLHHLQRQEVPKLKCKEEEAEGEGNQKQALRHNRMPQNRNLAAISYQVGHNLHVSLISTGKFPFNRIGFILIALKFMPYCSMINHISSYAI